MAELEYWNSDPPTYIAGNNDIEIMQEVRSNDIILCYAITPARKIIGCCKCKLNDGEKVYLSQILKRNPIRLDELKDMRFEFIPIVQQRRRDRTKMMIRRVPAVQLQGHSIIPVKNDDWEKLIKRWNEYRDCLTIRGKWPIGIGPLESQLFL